jgi:hypothetical protein
MEWEARAVSRKSQSVSKAAPKKSDDFESVARRLECDPDLKKFDAQLQKIARAKPPKSQGK